MAWIVHDLSRQGWRSACPDPGVRVHSPETGCRVVAQYDLTMKRLTSVFTRDYARFALGGDVGRAEPLGVEEQDKELPALSRKVDFVARVGREGERERKLSC